MKKILVTGSAGFMGSWIADELTRQGHNVLGVDNLSGGFLRNTQNHKFAILDLRDKYSTEKLVEQFKPDILYFLSASAREIGSLFEPLKSTEDNIVAYMNTLNACIKNKFKKCIFFSSMATFGNQQVPFTEDMENKPEDIYGWNKSFCEATTKILAEIHDFKWTIVKPHNVVGIRQSLSDRFRNVFAIWMNRIMHGEKEIPIFGDGNQIRAFSPIEFSLPCYIKCLESYTDSKVYNIGGMHPITLNEAAELVIKAMDVEGKVKIIHLPPRLNETKVAYCTYQKSIDELGYKENKDLLTCLKEMASWAKFLGPQSWTTDKLELYNEKAPLIWK